MVKKDNKNLLIFFFSNPANLLTDKLTNVTKKHASLVEIIIKDINNDINDNTNGNNLKLLTSGPANEGEKGEGQEERERIEGIKVKNKDRKREKEKTRRCGKEKREGDALLKKLVRHFLLSYSYYHIVSLIHYD